MNRHGLRGLFTFYLYFHFILYELTVSCTKFFEYIEHVIVFLCLMRGLHCIIIVMCSKGSWMCVLEHLLIIVVNFMILRVEFTFTTYLNGTELITAIEYINYKGGNTRTGAGLKYIADNFFSPSSIRDVPKVSWRL